MILPAAWAACVAVAAMADQITAGDLAASSPAFASLAADTPLAWAPAPGVQRLLRAAELRRMAERLGVGPPPARDACVERPVAPLDPARLLSTLESALPGARLQLLDYSRQPTPQGALEFPRAGLRREGGGAIWDGYVRYAGNRRFAVWAKLEVRAANPAVVAVEDLQPGQPLEAGQLRVETREGFPESGFVPAVAEAVGKQLRRAIRAGAAVPAWALEEPPAIRRGDTVQVTVWSGAAHFELEALAESAAAAGQRVSLRNPVSHKLFFARAETGDRASIGQEKP